MSKFLESFSELMNDIRFTKALVEGAWALTEVEEARALLTLAAEKIEVAQEVARALAAEHRSIAKAGGPQ